MMPTTSIVCRFAAVAAMCLTPPCVIASPPAPGVPLPQRVMSLNLCADQLLLALLPPERIASLTWLSRTEGDPQQLSLARRLPVNHGSAEEVFATRPDLVVAGQFTTSTTRALLRGAGVPLLELEPVSDWEGIRRVTRHVADAVGARARAEQLLREMDVDLAAARDLRPAQPVRVMGWGGAGDDVPGRDTLFNTIIETAGAVNVAARTSGLGSFDLEQVLRARPQLLMRGEAYTSKPALRNMVAEHRVLRQRYGDHLLTYPEAVYGCGVPHAARMARELAETLRRWP
jgi:iron complex transport system substrate-binding protein